MRFILSSNPLDSYHSQIEIENFKEEQQQKKEFMNSVKRIADSAEQKADSAEGLANSSMNCRFRKIQSEIASKQSQKLILKVGFLL